MMPMPFLHSTVDIHDDEDGKAFSVTSIQKGGVRFHAFWGLFKEVKKKWDLGWEFGFLSPSSWLQLLVRFLFVSVSIFLELELL